MSNSTEAAEVNCILCNNTKTQKIIKKLKFKGAALNLVRCEGCSLAFLNPRLTKDQIKEVYSSDSLKNSFYYSDPESLADDKKTFLDRLNFLEKNRYLSNKKTVLDIGASVGTFLSVCKDFGFASVYGVELNEESRKQAKDIFKIQLSDDLPQGVKSNLVNMSDLIEHLENPLAYLKELKNYMDKDGIVLITTPDFDRWITHLVNIKPDEHLYYFTKETLRKTLENAGFEICYIGNTTRFRRFKHLANSTNAKNPVIKYGLKTIVTLKLDQVGEKIFFNNLNNDIICVAKKK